MDKVKIGDTIKIIKMEGEPQYTNREGVVTHIDDAGQIHGTWGGCAIIPEVDTYIIVCYATCYAMSLMNAFRVRFTI